MNGNVHPNPGPISPCSVCTGNVTWRSKSVQCCACSKWVHLRCSQLSLSQFRALGSSHSWSCTPCRITVTPSSDSSDMYTSTVQSSPPLLTLLSCPTLVSKPLIPICPFYIFSFCPSTVSCSWFFLLRLLPPPLPDSLKVLQWNAGGLRARSTELLHFLLSHPVDLICIQESNLNSCSSFWISGFSALCSDRTHFRSGILSSDTTHASSGVVIFVRQGISFSELSILFLPSLDPYSNYVGINISLNNSSLLSFLDVHAPPYSLLPNGWQKQLLFSLHPSQLKKSLHSRGLQLPSPPLGLKRYLRPPRAGSIQLSHLL